MATAYSGSNVLTKPRWQAGMEYTAVGYYALTGAVVTGDTYTWTDLLPDTSNPVQILSATVWGAELDTHASPTATLIVGDGTDTDGYLASKTAGDATGQMQFLGDGAVIGTAPASNDVVATVGGSVATAATTGTVWVMIRYYCKNA